MEGFKDYLRKKKYRPSSIANISCYVRRFKEWFENENLELADLAYSDLLGLVKHFRDQDFGIHNLNCHLSGIQTWLDYQRQKGNIDHNPMVNLRVKGKKNKLPTGLLNKDQLEEIYQSYSAETLVRKRNKLILSLFIYQALVREKIQRLEPCDVNLIQGTIRIKKNVKLQSRILKLKAEQILPLQEYLGQVRPKLVKKKGQSSDSLFVTTGSGPHIKESVRELLNQLRIKHPYFRSFLQIRSSVISLWLQEKNIRQVQYMAGHNSVISTQRYIKANLDELKIQLNKYHPLI